jgi:hypothetical protein
MKVEYSPHSQKRLKLRGIAKAQVLLAILKPDAVLSASRNRLIARKKLNGKTLEVIYVKESGKIVIITLYYL